MDNFTDFHVNKFVSLFESQFELQMPDWYKDSEIEKMDINFLNYKNLIDDLFFKKQLQQTQQQQQKQ